MVKDGGEYRVALRFLDLGMYAKRRISIYNNSREAVQELAEESGEIAHFMVEEHGTGVYMHKDGGSNVVRTASYEGDRKHLHCTAPGKALLSQLPHERIDWIIERHGFPK